MTVAMVWRFGLIALPAAPPKAGDPEGRAGRDLDLTGERGRGGSGVPVASEPRAAAPGR